MLDFKVDAIAGSPSKPVKPVDSDLQPVIVQVDNPAAADDDPDVFLCRKCPFVSLKEDDLKRHFTDEHQSESNTGTGESYGIIIIVVNVLSS